MWCGSLSRDRGGKRVSTRNGFATKNPTREKAEGNNRVTYRGERQLEEKKGLLSLPGHGEHYQVKISTRGGGFSC